MWHRAGTTLLSNVQGPKPRRVLSQRQGAVRHCTFSFLVRRLWDYFPRLSLPTLLDFTSLYSPLRPTLLVPKCSCFAGNRQVSEEAR